MGRGTVTRGIDRTARRRARHVRIRKRVVGLPERPRVCVYRSGKHFYAQLVDDLAEKTLAGFSTLDKRLRGTAKPKQAGTAPAAQALGKLVAEETTKRGITRVVFDRGGYAYHGRVKAFAEALRAGGLQV